jgi:hypothetical protein
MKMGRRLRCSSVTYRFRYAPSSRLAGRPILITTKAMLFMGQDTRRVLSSLNSKAIPPFERCLDAGLRGEALFLCNRREVNQLPKLDGTNVIYLYTR